MPNKKISDLIATNPVTVPLQTDQFETTQGGISKGTTNALNLHVQNIHVNTSKITINSPDGEKTLLDAVASKPLETGTVICIEAFGQWVDPGLSGPSCQWRIKVGGVLVLTQVQGVSGANWYFKALLTVRVAGAAGTIVATLTVLDDNGTLTAFPMNSTTTVLNTTGTPAIDFTAQIDNITGTEQVLCEQCVITKIF
jgi:hypothetical protein